MVICWFRISDVEICRATDLLLVMCRPLIYLVLACPAWLERDTHKNGWTSFRSFSHAFVVQCYFRLQCSSQARPNHHPCAAYQQVNMRHYCKQQIRSHAELACTLPTLNFWQPEECSLSNRFFCHHRLSTSLKQAQNDEVSDGGVLPETKVILVINGSLFPFFFFFFFSCLSAKPCFPKTCGRRMIIHAFIRILPHSNARKVHSKFFFNFVVYMLSYIFMSTHPYNVHLIKTCYSNARCEWNASLHCVSTISRGHAPGKTGVTVTHIDLLTTRSQLSSRGAP